MERAPEPSPAVYRPSYLRDSNFTYCLGSWGLNETPHAARRTPEVVDESRPAQRSVLSHVVRGARALGKFPHLHLPLGVARAPPLRPLLAPSLRRGAGGPCTPTRPGGFASESVSPGSRRPGHSRAHGLMTCPVHAELLPAGTGRATGGPCRQLVGRGSGAGPSFHIGHVSPNV